MFDIETPEPENLYPTDFDQNRLNDLGIDEKLESETGLWTVFRYKDCYFLCFDYLPYVKKRKLDLTYEFPTLKGLIYFLKHH